MKKLIRSSLADSASTDGTARTFTPQEICRFLKEVMELRDYSIRLTTSTGGCAQLWIGDSCYLLSGPQERD